MATDDRKTNHTAHPVLVVAVTLLAVVSGTAGIVQKIAQLGPQVGDVVAFDPARPAPFDSIARLAAERPRQTRCVLDVGIMQKSGGSIVVERRGGEPQRLYQAHWAGARTSVDTDNCGSDAVLLLSRIDLNALAAAVGGFGVRHDSLLSMQ